MVNSSPTISASLTPKRSRSPESPHKKATLHVKNQQGIIDVYKIGFHVNLKKLMDAYCEKRNLEYTMVRFIYNGKSIKPRQTPAQLSMENGDEISVVIEFDGGGPYVA